MEAMSFENTSKVSKLDSDAEYDLAPTYNTTRRREFLYACLWGRRKAFNLILSRKLSKESEAITYTEIGEDDEI